MPDACVVGCATSVYRLAVGSSLVRQSEELGRTYLGRYARYAEIEASEPLFGTYQMEDAEICLPVLG